RSSLCLWVSVASPVLVLLGGEDAEDDVLAELVGDRDLPAARRERGPGAGNVLGILEGDVEVGLRPGEEDPLHGQARILPGAPDRALGIDRHAGAALLVAPVVVAGRVGLELAGRAVGPEDVRVALDVAPFHPGEGDQLPVGGDAGRRSVL